MIEIGILSRGMAFLALAGVASVLPTSSRADNSVVVELFTSQGCSSCPAADKLLGELRERPGVIALTLNVDYWDYLGWRDDLALPGSTPRQRSYSRTRRSRHVYTPQMIVDGRIDVVGSRRAKVEAAIDAAAGEGDRVSIDARKQDGRVALSLSPNASDLPAAVIWIVGYDSTVDRKIGAGENRGRTVTYSNVVREWREVGRWDGRSRLDLETTVPAGNGGFVVIAQEGETGPILGAAQVSADGQLKI